MQARTLYAELDQKRGELAQYFKDRQAADGSGLKMSAEECQEARRRNDELTDLSKRWEDAKEIEEMAAKTARDVEEARQPAGMVPFSGSQDASQPAFKSLGHAFIESRDYKSWQNRVSRQVASLELPLKGTPDLLAHPGQQAALKATLTTAASTWTGYDRQPMVLLGQQQLTVADLLAQGQTTMPTIRYPQEDTFTNAITTVTEGAAKPEISWDVSEVDAPVRKIAGWTKVTEEMFTDFPVIRDYINQRLPFMLRQAEEAQLLAGNGTAPNLTGILSTAGIQVQATSTDTNPDAIYKAIVKVRTVGFFEPDGVIINPANWTPIRLLKTTTGEYVWGGPSELGPERLWGLPVVVTMAITANTALVGAFKLGAQVFYREGVRLEATNTDQDDFIRNLITLRVEQREALAVYRPKAFCSVTGMGV